MVLTSIKKYSRRRSSNLISNRSCFSKSSTRIFKPKLAQVVVLVHVLALTRKEEQIWVTWENLDNLAQLQL